MLGNLLTLILFDEPVLNDGRGAARDTLIALDFNGHALVVLQRAGEVSLLGGLGGLGGCEGLDLADRVGVLDGGGLVRLELLEVELLYEVGCSCISLVSMFVLKGVFGCRLCCSGCDG